MCGLAVLWLDGEWLCVDVSDQCCCRSWGFPAAVQIVTMPTAAVLVVYSTIPVVFNHQSTMWRLLTV